MATSEEAICNSALAKLGADRIASLEEDSRAGKLCKEQYPKIRDMLLRAHPWNFAITRASLAASVTPPLFDYTASYPLPADCLRVLHVNQGDDHQWAREGNNIVSYEDTCEIIYIARVSVGYFDAMFSEVLALKLAHDMAGDLVTSPTLKRDLYAEYSQLLRETRSFDAQEGYTIQVRSRTFLNARR